MSRVAVDLQSDEQAENRLAGFFGVLSDMAAYRLALVGFLAG